MKQVRWIVFAAIVTITFVLVVFAPALGLGDAYDFLLYRLLGITRSVAVTLILELAVLLFLLELLNTSAKLIVAFFITLIVLDILLWTGVVVAPFAKAHVGGRALLSVYDVLGLSSEHGFSWLLWLAFGLRRLIVCLAIFYGLYWALSTHVSPKELTPHSFEAPGSRRVTWPPVLIPLVKTKDHTISRDEFANSAAAAVIFFLIFLVFLWRNLSSLQSEFDTRFLHANLDYDINWSTPLFSLTGNVLNHFDMQLPLNSNLSPLFVVAHLAGPRLEIAVSQALFYIALALIFWAVGRLFRLRAIPLAIFSGLTSLIMTIPFGLDSLIPFLPPFLFISQAVLTRFWFDATVMILATIVLFFWIGRSPTMYRNIAVGLAFAVACYGVLLVYPVMAVFSVPVLFIYCLVFLTTAENYRELLWKLAVGGALAGAMLLTNIPVFFKNLYSYAFGAYFLPAMSNTDPFQYLENASIATAYTYDLRVQLVFLVSFVMACICIVRYAGPLKRVALGVVACEIVILILSLINYLFFQFPVSLYYAEQIHAPLIVAFFVLCLIACFRILLIRIGEVGRSALGRFKACDFAGLIVRLRLQLGALSTVVILVFCAVVPLELGTRGSIFPPTKPPSVEIIESEIGLKSGGSFRGRALALAKLSDEENLDIERSDTLNPLITAVFRIFEERYGKYLGNDHWIDLLPFNIPIVNEYAHWTTPVNFLFLRTFFGHREDRVEKALFVLREYNERIARAIGVRLVVTNADTIPGGSLVYETIVGGVPLRLFRVEHTNIGQYSPTNPIIIQTASGIIAAMTDSSFDPERDVLVEEQIQGPIVGGTLLSLTTESGAVLSIGAVSSGKSLLLLPFEYSHCLKLETLDGTSARLVAANLQQTGLLFEHSVSARITYRFGPLDQPQCRGDDLMRADRLKLRDALR